MKNTKHQFNKEIYKFRELVSEAFDTENLEKIHESKSEWISDDYKKLNIHNENTTKFHQEFYKRLNDNWTEFYDTYDDFIHNLISYNSL